MSRYMKKLAKEEAHLTDEELDQKYKEKRLEEYNEMFPEASRALRKRVEKLE